MTFTTNGKQSHELPSSLVASSALTWEGQVETAGALQRMWLLRKKGELRPKLCGENEFAVRQLAKETSFWYKSSNLRISQTLVIKLWCSFVLYAVSWGYSDFDYASGPVCAGFLPLSPSNSLTYQRLKSHRECEIKLSVVSFAGHSEYLQKISLHI